MKKTFTEKVYEVVKKIPKGGVLTYKEVARRAGNPRGARAVGTILSKNYNPAIPCHRVLRSDGGWGGYNRGIRKKQKLLQKEGFNYNTYMKKGFTILEVLTIVAILGILASVVFFSATKAREKARNAQRVADIQKIAKAIDSYVVENNGKMPPLPMSSDGRPGITSYDLNDDGVIDHNGGWRDYMKELGLNLVLDPFNQKPLQGVSQSSANSALLTYSYIVAYKGITFDPDNNPATPNWEVYAGDYDLPMIYARIEGTPTPCVSTNNPAGCTPICVGGVNNVVGAPYGSGYGSSNCKDLTKGCIPPTATFGTNAWVCIPLGYNE